jgi:hypothetical protein
MCGIDYYRNVAPSGNVTLYSFAGMKTLVWSITHVNASQMQVSQASSAGIPLGLKGMREDEV